MRKQQFERDFLEALPVILREGLLQAAEPILQQALSDIEARMRRELAARVVGMIESDYSVSRMESGLRIEVKFGKPDQTGLRD